jgi:hypothetical protein
MCASVLATGLFVVGVLASELPSASAGGGEGGHELASLAQASAGRNFEETLRMDITKRTGKRVAARGQALGTVSGNASIKFILVNGSDASIRFSGRNAHGTLSGTGVASYRVNGAISSYSGRITRLEGTGRYARAASRGISFSGTVNRRTYKVKASLSGRWSA